MTGMANLSLKLNAVVKYVSPDPEHKLGDCHVQVFGRILHAGRIKESIENSPIRYFKRALYTCGDIAAAERSKVECG